jgi:flagellar basal body P-ring formation protein FlgA
MNRLAPSLFVTALLLSALPASADPAPRPAVTVRADVIRLGDIFSDAGSRAGDIVAPAPGLGMRTIYDADWLAATAHAHHLSWTPGSAYPQVTVERASRVIDADAILPRLMAEIAQRQSIDAAELQLDNPGLRLVVPAEAADAIAIDGLTVESRSGRVAAIVSAPAGDPAAQRVRVSGKLIYRVELPALAHPLAPGAVITAADLTQITVRRDSLGQDVSSDANQLIGKTPRRALRVGEPVRLADLQLPILIHKGELVTMLLETGELHLTAQGQALEDGARGALIRVSNSKSSRLLDATIVGAGLVRVIPPDTLPVMAAKTAANQE